VKETPDTVHGALLVVLVVGLVWIAALATAPLVAARPHDDMPRWQQRAAAVVYLAGSVICHQRPERSYQLNTVPLPVCARCTGLHVGALLGLFLVAVAPRSWRGRLLARARVALVAAALPTGISVAIESMGGGSPLLARTLTALPAGAMVGALIGLALCYTTVNVASSTEAADPATGGHS
jgi:uncharacterized membrane protein